MARRKIKIKGVDPAFLDRQKAALVRKHRQVICLNDKEMEAVSEYCRRFGVKAKATLYRQAIMDKVLSELEESHPTLF